MKGILLYKVKESELNNTHYETRRFLEEAANLCIDLDVMSPDQFELFVNKEDECSIYVDGEPLDLPDFVIPRMGSGTTYFALALIRQFERMNIPCINSSVGIETVKDKLFSQQILAQKKMPVPKTMLMKFPVDVDFVTKQFEYPLVVKTLSGSLGKGVFLMENRKQLEDLSRMIEIANPNMNIIIQEMIKDSKGKDLRVFVVGGRVVGCMLRKAKKNDFRANYSAGGTVESYPLSPIIEWIALEASKILGLDIAGVDLLFDGESFKICEVNSSPMFKGLESCTDVNIPKVIFKYAYDELYLTNYVTSKKSEVVERL
ncbi:ATP-grasp domain-containing protein [Vallitalea guaymasensis]|uniref:ATP-grasp domain-containing protein n=1 Tax=Vallitalea guaymasensis TaxID=1185412 RepID=UPI000DE57098|nr:RimK family alpha-L-glutamate ligase [Vallitalea guaymasensis]